MIANDNPAPANQARALAVQIVGVVGEGGRVTLFRPLARPAPALRLVKGDRAGRGDDAPRR